MLSHDEVVHGKKSLLSKMPGDLWQKFANLRLLYSYMMCMSGKKLFFMSGEIGQWNEWNSEGEIEWMLLDYPLHQGIQKMVKELNQFYLQSSELWDDDFAYTGFEWVDFRDEKNSVISFKRKSSKNPDQELLCVFNFTPTYHEKYEIHVRGVKKVSELFNSDDTRYGGSGKNNTCVEIMQDGFGGSSLLRISLSPLACTILRIAN